jgi:hypothetical protein
LVELVGYGVVDGGAWLVVWVSNRRRMAEKPTSRSRGRLHDAKVAQPEIRSSWG